MQTRELYEVLGLQPFADGAMVDQAYWHLAKSFQTLAVTDPRARQALDDLNEAYGVLGTPRLREEYDQSLSGAGKHAAKEKLHTTTFSRTKKGFAFPSLFRQKTTRDSVVSAVPAASAPQEPRIAAQARARRSKSDVGDLQASTGQMLKRWRANAGIEPRTLAGGETVAAATSPDTTLVDIFRTEREVADEQDPLNAVMDVLKSTREPTATPLQP